MSTTAATTTGAGLAARSRPREAAAEAAKNIPVKIWASIGGVILLFEAYVIIRWVTGPYFTPTHVGASKIPTWMQISLHTQEVVLGLILLYVIWRYIVQPFRLNGRVSSDGLMSISILVFAWFQDPLANYSGTWFTYNSGLVNMGSWLNDVPGAVAQGRPGAQIGEGILWDAFLYPGVLFLVGAVFGTWFMRKVKERRPQTTTLGLLAAVYALQVFLDLIWEGVILMPLGAYTYQGAPNWISINTSHYYKYPFYEGLAFGATMTCWAALRYFTDDRGNTFVERGLDRMKLPAGRETGVRLLAIGAFVSLTMFACTTVPWNLMAMHQSAWPKDIQKRTYFTQGLCGIRTSYACPGPSIPMPRGNDGAHVAPNGTLVVPRGTELPKPVPIQR
jgi:Spirocyclase AveC-like